MVFGLRVIGLGLEEQIHVERRDFLDIPPGISSIG